MEEEERKALLECVQLMHEIVALYERMNKKLSLRAIDALNIISEDFLEQLGIIKGN